MKGLVVGRHVFYEDVADDAYGGSRTRAAIVSHVWPGPDGALGTMVNLIVINRDGTTRPASSVNFDERTEGPWSGGKWRWMFEQQATALAETHQS